MSPRVIIDAHLCGEQPIGTRVKVPVTGWAKDKLLGILGRMGDGILITSPDYKIRFMNSNMIRDFGEGIGSHCYKYLHNLESPCDQVCKLPNVIAGEVERWEYNFPDGRIYEVLASPYLDTDGVVCQLTTFRNITG